MNLQNLDIIKELSEKDIPVKEQAKLFIKKTKFSIRTFYNLRRKLNIKSTRFKEFKYSGQKVNGICYFCLKKSTLIHHIDTDNKNNSEENLVKLCKSCHNKIHRIYNNLLK